MQTRQKNILRLFSFFFVFSFFVSGRGIFIYHKFSHLTTIYFIRKNSYFPYTIFLLEHNRIFSHHHGVVSEHNRIFSHHSRVFSAHNKVFPEHNRVFPEHNEVFPEHNEVLLEQNAGWDRQKYEENGRILHNLALV